MQYLPRDVLFRIPHVVWNDICTYNCPIGMALH